MNNLECEKCKFRFTQSMAALVRMTGDVLSSNTIQNHLCLDTLRDALRNNEHKAPDTSHAENVLPQKRDAI